MATLFINSWSSRCGDCNHECDPHEKSHKTNLGYGGPHPPGCGVTYTHVSSDYMDEALLNIVKKMRPDLEFIDPTEAVE